MQKLHLISIQKEYLDIVAYQLFDIFGDEMELFPITLQQLTMDTAEPGDIVVLSKEVLRGITSPFIPESCKVIVANREVNIAAAEKLASLPKDQHILIINDTMEHAVETADSLKQIFYEHTYLTYDPVGAIPSETDWIVTPGELQLVPAVFTNVIDIGPRTLDYTTVKQIAGELGSPMTEIVLMNRYFKSQVVIAKRAGMTVAQDSKEHIEEEESAREITRPLLSETDIETIKNKIERVGFLNESLAILQVYKEGKDAFELLGRTKVKKRLHAKGIVLSDQQLRVRLEAMQEEQLIHARIGRGGTRISEKGEAFLRVYYGTFAEEV